MSEPLSIRNISQWITGVRDLMPNAQIRFTTNGLLLDKKFEVVEQLHSIGNSIFKISIHQNNKKKLNSYFNQSNLLRSRKKAISNSRNFQFKNEYKMLRDKKQNQIIEFLVLFLIF